MKREDVYKAIDTERKYQDRETKDAARFDIVDNFSIGQAILAMDVLLDDAKQVWYGDSPEGNYQETMHLLRKVAGVCVQMGEKYGMPERSL